MEEPPRAAGDLAPLVGVAAGESLGEHRDGEQDVACIDVRADAAGDPLPLEHPGGDIADALAEVHNAGVARVGGDHVEHPVGGPILRDLLAQSGQNADVLRPVRKLAIKRLVKLSKGKFPADLIDELVRRVAAGDITDDAAITRIVAAAGDTIDALANVAGIMDDMTPVAEVSDAVWNRVFAINVTGTMKLMRAVVPSMLAVANGSIVNVASEAALRGSAAGAASTASKHAVVGLTKSSAFMYGPSGIRVNAVALASDGGWSAA